MIINRFRNIDTLTKYYYSIGEVAEMYKVTTSLLRYWEKEFSVLKPKKNRRGDRQFTQKDIEIVDQLYQLIKIRGFTLEGAKKALKNPNNQNKSENNNQLIINKLEGIKNGLLQIKKDL